MKNFLLANTILIAVGMFNLSAYADDAIVGPGKKVTLDYTLTVDNVQVETSKGKTPLSYVAGTHEIIPGLEAQLNGMRVNEEKTITVAPKDAYGEVNPKAYKEYPKSSLPKNGFEAKVGATLWVTTPNGMRFPVKVFAVKDDKVTIDFNHPMAGKTLVFKVKVLNVEKAPASAMPIVATVQ